MKKTLEKTRYVPVVVTHETIPLVVVWKPLPSREISLGTAIVYDREERTIPLVVVCKPASEVRKP